MIHIIRTLATQQQIDEMMQALETYIESLINIRPRQANPSMEILDPQLRDRVAQIVRQRLEQA